MPPYRFYSEFALENQAEIELSDREAVHALKVMRCEVGNEIELIDGQGGLSKCIVIKESKRGLQVKAINFQKAKQSQFKLHLEQWLPRAEALSWIVEKATELGTTSISIVVPGEKLEILKTKRLQRLKSIAIAALKQSGNLFLPIIDFVEDKYLTNPGWQGQDFFGDQKGDLAWPLLAKTPQSNCILRIGPESGFLPSIRDELNFKRSRAISFSKLTLRVETAVVSGLTLINSWQQS